MSTANASLASTVPVSRSQPAPDSMAANKSKEYEFKPFGEDGLTFFDFLDVINPLQHIPVISALYRDLTGDEIDPIPRLVGGTLFGGVIGAIASLVNVVVDEVTGSDIGEHAVAFFGDVMGTETDQPGTALAQSTVAPQPEPLMVPLVATSNPNPQVAAFSPSGDIFDWPRRESAFKNTEGFERGDPRAEDLARKLAVIQQREMSRVALSAMASYGKGQMTGEPRQDTALDIES